MKFSNMDYAILKYGNMSILLFSILGLLGFAMLAGFWPPPQEYLTAEQLGQYYRENNLSIRIGMVIMLNAVPFYLVWGLVFQKVIDRIGDGTHLLGRMQLAGAITSSIILTVPAAMWIVGAFRPDIRTDAEIQLMYDLGWMLFDLPFLFFGVQYISAGIAILLDKREKPLFPRWIAWLGFFDTFTFIAVLMIPFVQDGPFAWHGLISFWVVFVTFFVYLLAVMMHIPGVLRRLQEEDKAANT